MIYQFKPLAGYEKGQKVSPIFSNDYPNERYELEPQKIINKILKGGVHTLQGYNGYNYTSDFIKRVSKNEFENDEGNRIADIWMYFNYGYAAQFDLLKAQYESMPVNIIHWNYAYGYIDTLAEFRQDPTKIVAQPVPKLQL